jgi:ribosomal protein L37E
MKTPEQDYNAEWEDIQPYEMCPKCGRQYDDIDFDYQSCSKCGWDAENEKRGKARKPNQSDYDNGDADILTGLWS